MLLSTSRPGVVSHNSRYNVWQSHSVKRESIKTVFKVYIRVKDTWPKQIHKIRPPRTEVQSLKLILQFLLT